MRSCISFVRPSLAVRRAQSDLVSSLVIRHNHANAAFSNRLGFDRTHALLSTRSSNVIQIYPFRSRFGAHQFSTAALPSDQASASSSPPSRNVKQLIIETAKHYWTGTKHLYHNFKESRMLKQRLAAGDKLTRKEQRFIWQTNQDIKAAIPFLIIAAAPLVGYLLPVLISIFPDMLPSTYRQESFHEKRRKELLDQREKTSEQLSALLKRAVASQPQLLDVMKKVSSTFFFFFLLLSCRRGLLW